MHVAIVPEDVHDVDASVTATDGEVIIGVQLTFAHSYALEVIREPPVRSLVPRARDSCPSIGNGV